MLFRSPGVGEIDLVARREQLLVICEVKTRRTDRFGSPALAVSESKRRRLRRLATAWLSEHGWTASRIRFDVAAVCGSRIDVFEDAF